MMKTHFRTSLSVAALLLSGCSTLKVTKLPANPNQLTAQEKKNLNGVPYYLPRQDFVVTELGYDENGKPAANKVLKVDLVTRPDLAQGYTIVNSPGPFSTGEFEISRDVQGRLLTISAKSEDKTAETITALASFVIKAAAFAGKEVDDAETVDDLQTLYRDRLGKKNALEARIEELKVKLDPAAATAPTTQDLTDFKTATDDLTEVEKELKQILVKQELIVLREARFKTLQNIERLSAASPQDGKELKLARENLAALIERIATLQASLAASAGSKGVTKSATKAVKTMAVGSSSTDIITQARALALEEKEIGILLIPR
jgi:hypothetical protein